MTVNQENNTMTTDNTINGDKAVDSTQTEIEKDFYNCLYDDDYFKNDEQEKKKSKKKWIIIISVLFVLIIAGIFSYFYFFEVPIVKYKGEQNITVSYGQHYIEEGIDAYTRFKNINNKIIIESDVDETKVGTYKVTYKVPHMNKYKIYTRNVTIVDDKAPELKLEGENEITISYGTEFQDPGYNAVDNYDGEMKDKVNISKEDINDGLYKIWYEVTDSSGNQTKISRTIKVVDDVKPEIHLVGNQVVCVVIGNEYKEQGATATDNKDGDITSKIKTTGEVNTGTEGTYIIKYEISDEAGNKSEIERKVIVNSVEKAGVIYLTFDDGPSTTITPHILDILKEKGVHATFFILNYSDGMEYLVKREIDEGNAVGIHGYSHDYSVAYASADACYDNIKKLQDKIANSTGKTVKIVRFPGGSSNTISKNYCEGVMTQITQRILAEGFRYYDWNVASGDTDGVKTKEGVYNNVTAGLQHGRNNIVLMHDFSGNNKTLEALPEIIDFGLENGYVFDVITENTPMVTHPIAN